MSRSCEICDKDFSCRQSLWKHMKSHQKKNGEGLFTQKMNGQLQYGYGLKSKYDLDERKHGEDDTNYKWKEDNRMDAFDCSDDSYSDSCNEMGSEDESDDSYGDEKEEIGDIGKYVWEIREKNNRKHSPLLPRDIRAIIVGKSGAGKSVFLTYLLLEPDMLDYDNLIVCGPSLHQPIYNVMNKGFSVNLSKNQVRNLFKKQELIKEDYRDIDEIFENNELIGDGGVNAEFIDDVDLIPDPSEFDESKKNVLVLDDVLLGPQNKIEDMYTRGRHNGIDTFYLAQNYFKLPRQTIRENANFIVLFPQDMKNLNHIYNDHCSGDGISCNQFHDFCSSVWRSGKHKYVILDLTRDVDHGKYRTSLQDIWIPS